MIKTTWDKVSLIGITKDTNFNKANALTSFLNQFAFLICMASVLTGAINIALNSTIKVGSILSFSLAIMIWVSHYKGEYNYPKYLVSFIFPLVISYVMLNSKSNFACINVFLVIVILSFIIYESNWLLRLSSILFTSLICLGNLFYIVKFKPTYHIDLNPYNDFVIFISALASLAMLIAFYQRIILNASKNQKTLLDALKNKNIELERFAYVTSHDLKEPVRNIENLSNFVRDSLNDRSYLSRNKKMIGMIKESSNRMSSLIDSILSYSKLETKDLPVEEIELDEIVNDFINSHANIMKDRNASVVSDSLPSIVANKTFISLLFQNLIENGFKYNSSEQPLVEIYSELSESGNLIKVSDNGIGINEEFRSHIFEPFKRLHNSQSFKGSGLGLSICKKIVDMHDGKIWVEDNPSGGSIFNLNLPISIES